MTKKWGGTAILLGWGWQMKLKFYTDNGINMHQIGAEREDFYGKENF